jgi:hypothetical protein
MKVLRFLAVLLGSSTLFLAAQPVATVTSSAAFELQGHEVNVAGVPSWPVAAGDVVATHSAPATIQLREGARITLLEDSRVRIESTTGTDLKVDLLAGRLRLGSTVPKQAAIFVDGKPVQVVSGTVLGSRKQAPPRNFAPPILHPAVPVPVSSK